MSVEGYRCGGRKCELVQGMIGHRQSGVGAGILTPCLRRRGHGQEWVRAVEESTTQRQHSQGNRPDVLGTPDPELVNQGHAMSKHSRARSHHSLHISDPRWATPTTTPLGQIKTSPSGLLKHHSPTPLGHQ
ncbi:hypothetical protein AVEN_60126-1 [Araneus ventricosus]|uniref:Uncharacterized protein n=1 Tax=Araneus ventricosus TaxID=182803 RepID=A0A4Y2GH56_ARAVE|nr:hypothetical protein AVEN_60126-1 [Araneus ventricosus]